MIKWRLFLRSAIISTVLIALPVLADSKSKLGPSPAAACPITNLSGNWLGYIDRVLSTESYFCSATISKTGIVTGDCSHPNVPATLTGYLILNSECTPTGRLKVIAFNKRMKFRTRLALSADGSIISGGLLQTNDKRRAFTTFIRER